MKEDGDEMNNRGFTLVELLGSMVILGLLMLIVVPNVVGLLNSNKETVYVEDAKKLVNIAKTKATMKKDFSMPTAARPCVLLGLGYLDNSEFDTPPNGGCYDVNRSYVIIKLEDSQYKYYVQLVEYYKGKRIGILNPTLSTSVTKDTITTGTSVGLSFNYESNYDETTPISMCSGSDGKYRKTLLKNGPKKFTSASKGICAK